MPVSFSVPDEGGFVGREPRNCGEHCTVDYRAGMWCCPDELCPGCSDLWKAVEGVPVTEESYSLTDGVHSGLIEHFSVATEGRVMITREVIGDGVGFTVIAMSCGSVVAKASAKEPLEAEKICMERAIRVYREWKKSQGFRVG